MSKLKHTPGPWVKNKYLLKDCLKYGISESNSSMLNDIADLKGAFKTEEERESNARLIAAAPEMLEELILAYNNIKGYAKRIPIDSEIYYEMNGILSDLKEIIEKATGMSIEEVLNDN